MSDPDYVAELLEAFDREAEEEARQALGRQVLGMLDVDPRASLDDDSAGPALDAMIRAKEAGDEATGA